jgi:N-acetylmuramoyl-L-alanine amidase
LKYKPLILISFSKNGEINVIPDKISYDAVLDALKGKDPTNHAVFFYNPKIATSAWMKNINKSNVKPIGNHVFFVVNN